MSVLAAKILLAPSFVVCASLVARRYGARVGGLVGGLPVVAGPILLVFALTHGRAFAAEAAAGTLLGILSLLAFIAVYSRLASRAHWGTSLIFGWASFFAMTACLSAVVVGVDGALLVVMAGVALTLLTLPRAHGDSLSVAALPAWDLPLRALSALALVLALTALAGQLGAKLSGLLVPFPVIASVLAVFTHAQHGEQDLLRIMRGFVMGLVAYALFCFALAVSLESLSIAASFLLAAAAALTIQTVALAVTWRRREPAAEPL
ncbi:MAG TPA: hypothetical protein VGI26_11060 [Solirubrobacteraceae bacterium]